MEEMDKKVRIQDVLHKGIKCYKRKVFSHDFLDNSKCWI